MDPSNGSLNVPRLAVLVFVEIQNSLSNSVAEVAAQVMNMKVKVISFRQMFFITLIFVIASGRKPLCFAKHTHVANTARILHV